MKTFYFGCWGDKGHYLWTPTGDTLRRDTRDVATPWTIREMDAPSNAPILQPAETRAQGVWRLSHRCADRGEAEKLKAIVLGGSR